MLKPTVVAPSVRYAVFVGSGLVEDFRHPGIVFTVTPPRSGVPTELGPFSPGYLYQFIKDVVVLHRFYTPNDRGEKIIELIPNLA